MSCLWLILATLYSRFPSCPSPHNRDSFNILDSRHLCIRVLGETLLHIINVFCSLNMIHVVLHTVCPKSLVQIYVGAYYKKWDNHPTPYGFLPFTLKIFRRSISLSKFEVMHSHPINRLHIRQKFRIQKSPQQKLFLTKRSCSPYQFYTWYHDIVTFLPCFQIFFLSCRSFFF